MNYDLNQAQAILQRDGYPVVSTLFQSNKHQDTLQKYVLLDGIRLRWDFLGSP